MNLYFQRWQLISFNWKSTSNKGHFHISTSKNWDIFCNSTSRSLSNRKSTSGKRHIRISTSESIGGDFFLDRTPLPVEGTSEFFFFQKFISETRTNRKSTSGAFTDQMSTSKKGFKSWIYYDLQISCFILTPCSDIYQYQMK